jgi:hypothetical protein
MESAVAPADFAFEMTTFAARRPSWAGFCSSIKFVSNQYIDTKTVAALGVVPASLPAAMNKDMSTRADF